MVEEIDFGVRSAPPAVTDNREAHQFELTVDGQTSVLIYERRPHALALVHTEVPPALRGRGLPPDSRKRRSTPLVRRDCR